MDESRETNLVKIAIRPGMALRIGLVDADGEFEIHYDTVDHPKALVVKETGGHNGSVKGKAFEIMHHEQFGDVSKD